jgi:replicative DNA helicase
MTSQLPTSPDIERAILASFIFDRTIFDRYKNIIEPELFYDSKYRAFFEYMIEINDTEMILIANRYPDKRTTLAEIMQSSSSPHLHDYIDILRDKYYRRCIITASDIIKTEASQNYDKSCNEIYDDFLRSINLKKRRYEPEHISKIIPRAMNELRDPENGGVGIKTGLIDLDETAGYFYPGDYIIFAGRPGCGKSSMMATIIRNVSIRDGIPALIFSLEMSKELTANRIVFGEAGACLERVINRKYNHADELAKIESIKESVESAPIYIDDQPGVKLSRIDNVAGQYSKTYGVRLMVVDHMQLMSAEEGRSRNEEVSEISSGLKNIARKYGIVVVCLSQLSRNVESRKPPVPMLSDLRDSGSIEQDADKVVFLYHTRDTITEKMKHQIIVAKNRNGKTGTRDIFWDAESMSFKNVELNQYR